MKHTSIAQPLSRPLRAVLFAALLVGPTWAQAAECPASSPEDPQERRKLAKEWFGVAEAAESAGNDAEATRAYACSYKMVAHPFTAFNLGRVAERAGDNDLALKMFKAYITLKPDASDKEDVKARIRAIEDKLAAAQPTEDQAPTAAAEQPTEPPAEAVVPPTEPPPPTTVTKRPPAPESEGPPSRLLEWVVGSVAGATLVAGIAFNLTARSKMSTCQADADKNLLKSANDACESAAPLAYTSYAMFGIAAAGVVTEALLLILRHTSAGSSAGEDEAALSVVPLPGGAALAAHGRF